MQQIDITELFAFLKKELQSNIWVKTLFNGYYGCFLNTVPSIRHQNREDTLTIFSFPLKGILTGCCLFQQPMLWGKDFSP
jgi:hypothetical protein